MKRLSLAAGLAWGLASEFRYPLIFIAGWACAGMAHAR